MTLKGDFFMIIEKEVKRYEATDYEHVLDFMKRVTTLETINNEIIEQSILIKESDKVAGMVSFEVFDQIGMIRYFIYDQHIVPDLLVNMFFELYRCAKEREINQLIAVASHPYARQLFELLGFVEMKKTNDLNVPDLLKNKDIQLMSIRF